MDPYFVEGDDPEAVHPQLAQKMDQAIEQIHAIQAEARKGSAEETAMPHWPVLIVRTPKGWTDRKSGMVSRLKGALCPPSTDPCQCKHGTRGCF